MRSRVPALAIPLVVAVSAVFQTACAPSGGPGMGAIKEDDLRHDVATLAHDDFLGREAGTPNELRAAAWLAERAQAAGLQPAGEDGSYFQFFPLRKTRVSGASSVNIGGRRFELWTDVIVTSPVDTRVDGALVWVGRTPAERIEAATVRGRPVAALLLAPSQPPAAGARLWEWRYARAAVRERSQALLEKGAAAVILVSDSIADAVFDLTAARTMVGRTGRDTEATRQRAEGEPPVLVVRAASRTDVSQGQRLMTAISSESFAYPSANVVAQVPGTDPTVGNEHVLFSAHVDHDGIRTPVDGDSIYNGADDNVTGCAALLAIGRAFVQHPGRRGALFVFHGAEEKGLIGSRWYAEHPTVARESIVAALNVDMIGRNAPDSAAVLGTVGPNRNSSALVEMSLAANDAVAGFVLDTLWDQPEHPEGLYFRSDHAPYSQAGIPALFYTSLLHPDYHTPWDETEALDFQKLYRFTKWIYATGWAVAQADQRPEIDAGWTYPRR